ncbi:hypothetical protein PUN28_017632 [Cardiocondyla obscurior]|uniref:Uncharacterized protein n=1 Tax=Cardiocondyla obscurior TaxID=286306 RepID=A0AAW2EJH8_9HYME
METKYRSGAYHRGIRCDKERGPVLLTENSMAHIRTSHSAMNERRVLCNRAFVHIISKIIFACINYFKALKCPRYSHYPHHTTRTFLKRRRSSSHVDYARNRTLY